MKNYTKLGLVILIVLGVIYGGNKYVEYIDRDTMPVVPVKTDKQLNDELESIMNEANFKKATVLRARKVVSEKKMKEENEKNESILAEEKAKYEKILTDEKNRHDLNLAEIEKENEAIRTEELSLVSSQNTFLK